jgi:hypothetical protein
MANVTFTHPLLRRFLRQYEVIRDCIAGEMEVKHRKTKYLPAPNPGDNSPSGIARYDGYLTRAVFYNVAQRTVGGMVGQIFLRDPIVEVPKALEPIIEDATGGGVPLQQMAMELAGHALPYGRAGLFIDYPQTNEPTSLADIMDGSVGPKFIAIRPWDILNWSVTRIGSDLVLNLVVFKEEYFDQTDGYTTVQRSRYRVLRLVNNETYQLEVYENKLGGAPDQTSIPVGADGKSFDRLPFTFVGSDTNDSRVSNPPMYDLCALNIAHYRNSADYEESIFLTGQPTPWAAGLTEEWVKNVMGDKIGLGSRAIVMLPVGGSFGIEQITPNTIAKEGMDQKEAQMLALGAKLVEGSQTQRTATEATYDNVSETSILSQVAKNTSDAIEFALGWAADYVGVPKDAIEYDLNTEFDLVNLSPQERQQLLKEWQTGAISFTEYRLNLRRAGVASQSDADAKAEIQAEEQQRLEDAVAAAIYTGTVGGPGAPALPGQTVPNPTPAPKQSPGAPKPPVPKPGA